MKKANRKNRIWEIDFFRGIALLLMIIFHLVFDLKEIYGLPVSYTSGVFYYVGKASALLFMLIAGVSSSFSRNNVKRGIKIFSLAMGITLVTYFFAPGLIIKFGILHFFGTSMMLHPLFKDMNKYVLLLLGTLAIIIGNYFASINTSIEYLFPIGIYSKSFYSSDYYPLFPWFGVFLYGMALSKVLYREKKSIFNFILRDNIISFMGRHSLTVYLIHQPLTLLTLSLIMQFV